MDEDQFFHAPQDLCHSLGLTPQAALGRASWRCLNPAGGAVVLHTGSGASHNSLAFLAKLPHLYTPFHYPRVLAAQPDQYLVYPFIPGTPFSQRDCASRDLVSQAWDLAGRLSALFRSLNLVDMYQGFKGRHFEIELARAAAGGSLASLAGGSSGPTSGMAQRRAEAQLSYAWAQECLIAARKLPGAAALLPPDLWQALAAAVEHTTSIHLAPAGTSLAHTAFTPANLLLCPDGQLAVLGWQVAPRPYNYMRLSYLAGCLLHSPTPPPLPACLALLQELPAIGYTSAWRLSFILALLDLWPAAAATPDRTAALCPLFSHIIAAALQPEPLAGDASLSRGTAAV